MDDKDKLKVVKMSDHDERASTWSVNDLLKDAIEVAKKNPQYKKALVLFLDEENSSYITRIFCAGIGKTSDVAKLLDIAHYRELRDMDRTESYD